MKRRAQIIALALMSAAFSAGCGGCFGPSDTEAPRATLLDPQNVTQESATLLGRFDSYGTSGFGIWEWGVCYGVRSSIDLDRSRFDARRYLGVASHSDGQRCVKSGDAQPDESGNLPPVKRPPVREPWGIDATDLVPDTEYAYRLYYRYDEVREGRYFFLPSTTVTDIQGGTEYGFFRTLPAPAGASSQPSAQPSGEASAAPTPQAAPGTGTVRVDPPDRLEVTQGGSSLAFVGVTLPEEARGAATLDVRGAPDGIAVTFSLGAPEGMPEPAIRYALAGLPPGSIAATLDLRIGMAVPPGSYVLELHARTAAGAASAPVTVIVSR